MFSGPSYSTKALHRPPARSSFFQVDVENDWDTLAEAIVGSTTRFSTQLDQLVLLLESHGVVVHRIPAFPSTSPQSELPSAIIRSPFVATSNNGSNNTGEQSTNERDSLAKFTFPPSDAVPSPSLFPRNAALVHGARVIEAPPSIVRKNPQSDGILFQTTAYVDALFNMLENAGAEVIRWPASAPNDEKRHVPEEQLVDVGLPKGMDTEDEGPHFSPSDIVILSPSLLITRLSSFTNNKGLEYLWSALSRPAGGGNHLPQGSTASVGSSHPAGPSYSNNVPARASSRPTTTLLVRITDPEAPATNQNSPSAPPTPSSRTPTFSFPPQVVPHSNVNSDIAKYIPLCRVLVPIDGRVMLYDPALLAEGEARRLKSVLDRVEEASAGGDVPIGGPQPVGRHKRDSVMSYGTFGSLDQSDDEGWQFISVDKLHSTSILLVSPRLALLSPLSSTAASNSSTPLSSDQDPLTNISKVLESFGVRVVMLPFADLNGVRDAVLVLRRESHFDAEEVGSALGERETWQQAGAGEEQSELEGCFGALFASLSTWLCGMLTSSDSSEADMSGQE